MFIVLCTCMSHFKYNFHLSHKIWSFYFQDYEDAFARLLRLGLNRSQEREIIHVLLHCCMNEQNYNPYYSYLAQKFATFDRRFAVSRSMPSSWYYLLSKLHTIDLFTRDVT